MSTQLRCCLTLLFCYVTVLVFSDDTDSEEVILLLLFYYNYNGHKLNTEL